ncbi:hypothetical protein HOD83_03370 [Candidatus Woesearchaeota archaeon]|jgi:hypothetical protein|nr:hypothetical protein [Candidatus Woesearchaeota archaeon]MBT4114050.1 hypothetical protein [Candidatus Woesearchaeota archaeon]MBT4248594.1 hypothetical protein [Candidatus Woesearchaeota archaeon]
MVLGLHTKAGVEEIHIDRLSKAKTTIRHMLNHREFEFVRKLELNDVGSLFLRNSNWDKPILTEDVFSNTEDPTYLQERIGSYFTHARKKKLLDLVMVDLDRDSSKSALIVRTTRISQLDAILTVDEARPKIGQILNQAQSLYSDRKISADDFVSFVDDVRKTGLPLVDSFTEEQLYIDATKVLTFGETISKVEELAKTILKQEAYLLTFQKLIKDNTSIQQTARDVRGAHNTLCVAKDALHRLSHAQNLQEAYRFMNGHFRDQEEFEEFEIPNINALTEEFELPTPSLELIHMFDQEHKRLEKEKQEIAHQGIAELEGRVREDLMQAAIIDHAF